MMGQRYRELVQRFHEENHCDDNAFVAECGFAPRTAEARATLALRNTIAHVAGVSSTSICPQHSFYLDLSWLGGLDSLDYVDLTMALEEELNVSIPDEKAEQLKMNDIETFDPRIKVVDAVKFVARQLVEFSLAAR